MTIKAQGEYAHMTIGSGPPDDLRWRLLQAARRGDTRQYNRLRAEIDDIEAAAAARRMEQVVETSRTGRLF